MVVVSSIWSIPNYYNIILSALIKLCVILILQLLLNFLEQAI